MTVLSRFSRAYTGQSCGRNGIHKADKGVLGVPRHGLLYTAWRDTHPSMADRVDFFNTYRSWQTGQGLRYGKFIKTAN
jgi:hypothetical protein